MIDKEELHYLGLVMNQFIEANGISKIDVSSSGFLEEFGDFLKERTKMSKSYLELLSEIGLEDELQTTNVCEVGKGVLDTITNGTSLSVLTPHVKGLSNLRVYNGNLILCKNAPYLISHDSITPLGEEVSRFITQNPYFSKDLFGWENLHNDGTSKITVGVYGKTSDRDYSKKIKLLKNFSDKLYDIDLLIESTTLSGNYYAVLSTDRKVKRLVKKI